MLQTSDHFYYMCTKYATDGDVHKYFNPYHNPYDAYINYQNILTDFVRRVAVKSGVEEELLIEQQRTEKKLLDKIKDLFISQGKLTASENLATED